MMRFNYLAEMRRILDSSGRIDESPSQKQIDFANAISKVLDIPLPVVFTKDSYRVFIAKYKDKYNDDIECWKLLDEEDSDLWDIDLLWCWPE